VKEDVWKKGVRKNASAKDLGPCHRIERGVHAKKGKSVFIVEGEKRRSTSICERSVEKRIHLAFQVAPNITSTLRGKKGWHTENGVGLSIHKSVDDKEWISFIPYCRYTG